MPYVITDPCIGTKDNSCVDVCPVDCIHPAKSEAGYEGDEMLYIDPDTCIDCGACEPVCPVSAIYPSRDEVPESQRDLIEANTVWYQDREAARAMVKKHMADQPELMQLAPDKRRDAHK